MKYTFEIGMPVIGIYSGDEMTISTIAGDLATVRNSVGDTFMVYLSDIRPANLVPVEVTYKMSATVYVQADSKKEAIEKALDYPDVPDNGQYIDDTWEVDRETSEFRKEFEELPDK